MNKQQLAATLWASANDLRGKMDASEYKNYILGFLFYKFLSEHQEDYLAKEYQITTSEVEADDIATIQEDLGYFIKADDLFSTWTKNIANRAWEIGQVAMAFEQFSKNINRSQRNDFKGIFEDVNLTSEKLGANVTEKESAVRKLLILLDKINIRNTNQGYDLFGFIYEYLIAQFAMASGKKAGEFYTPAQVSRIMAKIVALDLRHKENRVIYDPTVGSGSLLYAVGDEIAKHNPSELAKFHFYGQENNSTTYNIARMNLLMRGVMPANMEIRNGDTLREDWPYENDKTSKLVDAVVANPPYSAKWDSENHSKDPRFTDYGIAPATKADYAFLLHSLYHLKQDGIMAIVLPHGVLFRGNEEEKIRRKLLERRQIDAVIGLPAGIFTNTGIPTIVMILRKSPKHNNVLFIDASQGFRKEKNNNVLRERDIKKILDVYRTRSEISGFSHLATLTEIEQNQFNLNIPRYIAPSDNGESQNIEAHLKGGIPNEDIDRFATFWQAFPSLKNRLFSPLRTGFSQLNVPRDEIFSTIEQDADYQTAMQQIHAQINQWQANGETALLAEQPIASGAISEEFEKLDTALSELFSLSPFTDKYEAYQLLSDQWQGVILSDLEQLAELGYAHARTLEPNMVMKGKEEVQDGVKGALLDQSLIASRFFADEQQKLEQLQQQITTTEERLAEVQSELQNLLEGNEDEDEQAKLANILKQAKTNATKAKAEFSQWVAENELISDEDLPEKLQILAEIQPLTKQLKALKDELKAEQPKLDEKIFAKYTALSEQEIRELLAKKWFTSLTVELENITHSHSRQLANQLKALDERYAETLNQIRQQREQSEAEFWKLAEELIGGIC